MSFSLSFYDNTNVKFRARVKPRHMTNGKDCIFVYDGRFSTLKVIYTNLSK